jgi:KUP system potassium uptake protein
VSRPRSDEHPSYLLSLAALGVVFGDIGTSPLYALRECFHGPRAIPPTTENVFGILSLIFWSLVLVISVKYLWFVMRADNRGEGGILALLALLRPSDTGKRRTQQLAIALGLFGAALIYGDGMITPAISVLSAVEGIAVATPVSQPVVIVTTVAILVGVFLFQHRGTSGIGAVFGPIMLVWFITIAVLGLPAIVSEPRIVAAINPFQAIRFFLRNSATGFLTLGTVFLVVTGGEALYADLGHFGRSAITRAWMVIVLPALLVNYFGQGALLISTPTTVENPFYRMAPSWGMIPLVILATISTVIASQAVISGAFSLTLQAVQLGYAPRVEIRHTSERAIGQIYIPGINWALMLATIILVLGFRSSSNLAAAYGVAVSATMAITTILFGLVAHRQWGWSPLQAVALTVVFLTIDLAFLGANLSKIALGGWLPIVVGVGVYILLDTWRKGTAMVGRIRPEGVLPIDLLLQDIGGRPPARVSGVAVFLNRTSEGVPTILLHHLKHNKMLHERVILLSIVVEEIPRVTNDRRVDVKTLGAGFSRISARYGFMEDPDVMDVFEYCNAAGWNLKMLETTFYVGHITLVVTRRRGMSRWRKALFAFMTRNARNATAFFRIPPNRVVELGAQIEL